jgi:UDP-N-acetyl-D-glucosamine dehydrogenase
MDYKLQILSKISDNTEVVGIIGLGYVGLPLAVNFAEAGVKVIGFDKSEAKVNKINSGENYIKDIRDAVLREVVDRVKLEATTDFSKMKECDALIICVPTPLDKFRKPDMSYIEASCIAIGQNMKPGTFISLESTTYPTTTEDFMLPLIEESSKQNPHTKHLQEFVPLAKGDERSGGGKPISFKHGTDFWLAYSPERVDPVIKLFIPKTRQKYSAQ